MTQILIPAVHPAVAITSAASGFCQLSSGAESSVEANIKIVWRAPGTFSNIYVRVTQNQPATASAFNYRKGGVSGNQTASIPGATTGEFTDATHTDAVAAGDQINLDYVNASGGNTQLSAWSELFAPTTTGNTVARLVSGGSITVSSSGVNYFQTVNGISSVGTNANTEANAQYENQSAATLQNGFANVTTNSSSVATVKSRINGGSGNISVSITSGTTGFFEDTTHTDSSSSGDLINYLLNASAVTGLILQSMGADYLTTNGNTHYVVGSAGNATSIPTSTTTFYGIAGNSTVNATEATMKTQAQVAFTASFLECFLITNTISAASTLTFRKNAGAGNQTVSITASTTGYFQDAAHTDSLITTDEIDYRIVTGSTGTSLIFGNIGILAGYGGSGNATANPIGVAGTGAVGTVIPEQDVASTGVSATGSVGTPIANIQPTFTGVSGTGAVGTVTLTVSSVISPTGVSGTGAVGSVTPQVAGTVTGVSGSGACGSIVPQITLNPIGVAGTGAVGTVTVTAGGNVTVSPIGVAGTGSVGAVIPQETIGATGVSGSGAVGSVIAERDVGVTGVSGSGACGAIVPQITPHLTGVQGIGLVGTITFPSPGGGTVMFYFNFGDLFNYFA